MLLVSFAYFQRLNPGWNVNSRLALTFALAEQHSAKVDDYFNRPDLQTEDVAVFNGHYYSDKIIGVSLLGVPATWIVNAATDALDVTLPTAGKRYWITLLAVGMPGAVSGVLLFLLLLHYNRTHGAATSPAWPFFVSAVTILGTMAFSYATLFMGYLPAQCFLLAGLYLLERSAAAERASWLVLLMVGILAGASVLCEYLYAIPAGCMGGYIVVRARPRARVLAYVAGGIIGVAPFLLYTYVIFGAFTIPYSHHARAEFQRGMSQGLMGATWPRLSVLVLLTAHPFRGIFAQSPVLLMALVGLVRLWLKTGRRALAALVAIVTVTCLLYNSGYYMWWGGWSFSPRHLMPVLPFLGVALYFSRFGRAAVWLAALLAIPSVLVHLIVTATDPQVPEPRNDEFLYHPTLHSGTYPVPFTSQVLPAFLKGHTDPNLGTWLGLSPGVASVLPLLIFWAVCAILAWYLIRRLVNNPQTC